MRRVTLKFLSNPINFLKNISASLKKINNLTPVGMAIIKKQEITSVGHDMTATDWEIIFANDISNKILHIYILHTKYYIYIYILQEMA